MTEHWELVKGDKGIIDNISIKYYDEYINDYTFYINVRYKLSVYVNRKISDKDLLLSSIYVPTCVYPKYNCSHIKENSNKFSFRFLFHINGKGFDDRNCITIKIHDSLDIYNNEHTLLHIRSPTIKLYRKRKGDNYCYNNRDIKKSRGNNSFIPYLPYQYVLPYTNTIY